MSEKDKTHLIKLGNIETVAGVCPHCEEVIHRLDNFYQRVSKKASRQTR
jgi:hypothetical protein